MSKSNSFWQQIIGGLFALAFVSVLVSLLFSWGNATALTTVFVVLTGALVLVGVLPRIVEFTLSLKGVTGKLSKLESNVDKTKEDVEAIRTALRGILTKHEWGPLKGLSGTGGVELPRNMPRIIDYLHRLDALEYIKPHNPCDGLHAIEEIKGDVKFNLRDHYDITDAGKKYLEISEYLGIFKSGVDWWESHPYA